MDYDEAIDWLYGTQLFGIKLGLDGPRRMFEELDLFAALEGRTIFHVAGTNGKGSVCAMIDSICRAAGKSCGLFTSPHLVCFCERIRVDGSMIEKDEAAKILTQLRDRVAGWEAHPTFFELALTLAVEYFCQRDVGTLVMETGMGGRLDATNVLPASVSVITSISLDHQEWLGDKLETIAAEKAGIIKPGIPVITPANQPDEVLQAVEQAALERKAPLVKVDSWSPPSGSKLGLTGPHQQTNAALAAKAVAVAWPDLKPSVIAKGLQEVNWPGRFDRRPNNLVIDGAHNPDAVGTLVDTWKTEFGTTKATVIFGAADSKEVVGMLTRLAGIARRFIFVKLRAERGLATAALVAALHQSGAGGLPWSEISQLADAMEQARKDGGPVLVTGSLFLVGECLTLLEGDASRFEKSEQ